MKNEKNSKKSLAVVALLLVVAILAAFIVKGAWAKYTNEIANGVANVQVAKWNVTGSVDGTAQYTKEFTHVVQTKMAPGTSGVIPVSLDLNDTDVCVKYDIYIDSVSGAPAHVSFYKATESSGTYTKGARITTLDGTAAAITGYLELTGDVTNNPDAEPSEYIMWDWPYEKSDNPYATEATDAAYDAVDTAEGKAAGTMSVTVRVVATQVDPEDAANIDN